MSARTKDSGAPTFETLYRDYSPRVYRLARHLLGNAADAEDVVQEVFLQVHRKLATFRGDSALSTWLYRLAVNAALAYRRRRAAQDRERVTEKDTNILLEDRRHHLPLHPDLPTPAQLTLEHERQHLVDEAIAQLPHDQRDVVALADLEELPLQEVATILGLSIAAVKSRLHRARQQLREQLTPKLAEPQGELPANKLD